MRNLQRLGRRVVAIAVAVAAGVLVAQPTNASAVPAVTVNIQGFECHQAEVNGLAVENCSWRTHIVGSGFAPNTVARIYSVGTVTPGINLLTRSLQTVLVTSTGHFAVNLTVDHATVDLLHASPPGTAFNAVDLVIVRDLLGVQIGTGSDAATTTSGPAAPPSTTSNPLNAAITVDIQAFECHHATILIGLPVRNCSWRTRIMGSGFTPEAVMQIDVPAQILSPGDSECPDDDEEEPCKDDNGLLVADNGTFDVTLYSADQSLLPYPPNTEFVVWGLAAAISKLTLEIATGTDTAETYYD